MIDVAIVWKDKNNVVHGPRIINFAKTGEIKIKTSWKNPN